MSLSRKRKKELRKLQSQANALWESQQVLVGQASDVAREAGRQLGHFGREQVAPQVQAGYEKYAAPYVDRGVKLSKNVLEHNVVPAAGAVVGSALSAWDAANETRARLAAGRGFALPDSGKYSKKADKYAKKVSRRLSAGVSALEPKKKGMGAGGVIAIILGVAAAAGVLYAAWQTLRADDELWVADDPLRAPDA
ncbi:DNA helicase [Microbacterium sp. NPDC055910]|uniref:DNA helicase n=1 Tax=Microbacterium sp. NPDC055910 TaxID=3345659 RepID=UPI0035E34780